MYSDLSVSTRRLAKVAVLFIAGPFLAGSAASANDGDAAPPTPDRAADASLTHNPEPPARAARDVERILVLGRYHEDSSALRLSAPLIDTPMSVQVVSDDLIELQQVNDPQEALSNVSGAVRSGSFTGAGENFILRGFEQKDLMKDGFRAGEASNAGINSTGPTDMVNIERIEVLKGPTAVLFGRGEPGGMVNYVTRRPTFENSFDVQQRAGSFDFYRTAVHGNWNALPDKLALRFDAAYDRSDSFIDLVGSERYAAAPALLFNLAPSTTLLARAEFVDDERDNNPGVPTVNGRPLKGIPYGRYFGEPGLTRFDNQTWRGIVELDHHWNAMHHSRVSAHGRKAATSGAYFILFNFAGPSFDPVTGDVSRSLAITDFDDENSAVRIEHIVKFPLFGGSPFALDNEFLLAFEHENETDDRLRALGGHQPLNAFNPMYAGYQPLPLVPFPGFPINFTEQSAIDASSDSLLVLDRINLHERVYITAGARFEWFDARQSVTYSPGVPFPTTAHEQDPYIVNPTVGVVVKPLSRLSLYANYTESANAFRSFELTTANGVPLEPEQGRQWETGVKGEFFEGHLTATAAAFHVRKSDVAGADPANPLFSINAGSERSQGFEFDLSAAPLPGWKLMTNYAFTDTRVTDDPSGATSGNRRYGVPEHSGGVFSTYELQYGRFTGFGFGGGLFYASEVEIDNGNVGKLPGYVQADALAYYAWERWRFQLNAKNLLDKEYYFATGNGINAQPAMSRTIVGTLEFAF